jgi:hypothetical protein
MDKICAACAKDPNTHSFKKVSEKNGIALYYTQPAKASKYDDTEGILSHVDNALRANGSKPWRCVIDGTGFDMRHATEVQTGMGLVALLTEKYGTTLQHVTIINPTWHILGVIKITFAFVDESIKAKIRTIDDDKPHSILEFL